MRNCLRIAIVTALLAAPTVALAAGAGQTRAINCSREQYKPARITLSCGDAGIWLGHLAWSHWSRTSATATGAYNENTCTPTCSSGHTVSSPVTVTLSAPRACPRAPGRAFGRATFTFPSGTPPHAYHRYTFRCPL